LGHPAAAKRSMEASRPGRADRGVR
jgi:hypothetical protein